MSGLLPRGGASAGDDDTTFHVLVLARYLGFPHGMAASNRVRLLARAMVESGAAVMVLCTHVSERPPIVENTVARGEYQGVQYEYTTGCTVRSSRFLVRRAVAARGLLTAALRLVQMRLHRRVDCVYSYLQSRLEPTVASLMLLTLARGLGIPVAVDLCERPSSLLERFPSLPRWMSPLTPFRGVVAISEFLREWAVAEAARSGRRLAVMELPILADVNEQRPTACPFDFGDLLFAASPAYETSTEFILDAMSHVWEVSPGTRLRIAGWRPEELRSTELRQRVSSLADEGRLTVAGHLGRRELLASYGESRALLAPLLDDTTSQARFPSKIAEYLASGRPVVTTNVGEVRRYLSDGLDAFVSQSADPRSFAEKTLEALGDPARAAQVGTRGRHLAETQFHYARYGAALVAFLRGLTAGRDRWRRCAE